jgi:methylenetetrahydrofolate reductase (NADPH)
MTVIEKINTAEQTLFTFELVPPLRGSSFSELAQTIEQLLPYDPAYINITNHRAEQVTVPNADGSSNRLTIKRRAGTAAIAAAIKYRYGIDVVPHVVCGGYSRSEVEDMLLDFDFLGIHNILALRGDPQKDEPLFTPQPDGDSHAIDVLRQAMRMNGGQYLTPFIDETHTTQFCVGVAGYHEKHAEAPSLSEDIECLKRKVDAGASYIVTQMFFDNARYFDFMDRCRRAGIGVPIIPGIKPLATAKQVEALSQIFHITIPAELSKWVRQCATSQEVRAAGEAWCIAQCRELLAAKVPVIHFYTMSKADNVENVVRTVFKKT